MAGLGCNVETILACVLELKETLGDVATIEALCEKVDTVIENQETLEQILCAPCPLPLVGPFNGTTSVVEGDQTGEISVGDELNVYDDSGAIVGTQTVTAISYNAATNQTTIQATATLNAGVLNTAVKGTGVKAISALRKAPVQEGEAVKGKVV